MQTLQHLPYFIPRLPPPPPTANVFTLFLFDLSPCGQDLIFDIKKTSIMQKVGQTVPPPLPSLGNLKGVGAAGGGGGKNRQGL